MVLTVATLAVMLVVTAMRRGDIEFPGPTLLIFTVLAWSPLLVRGSRPLIALIGTVLFESLHLIVVPVVAPGTMDPGIRMGAYQPVPIATMIAAFTVAARLPRWYGWATGIGAGLVLLVVSVLTAPLTLLATDLVMFNFVVIATGVGVAVRTRADRIRRENEDRVATTRQAVFDERLRIARELHDVLAHNLTLLNAQASVAEYLLATDPAAAANALHGMSAHSAKAIDELRNAVPNTHVTPILGPDPSRSPTPGMQDVDALADAVRAAGTPVHLEVTGTPEPLTELGDLAAYRIVQEALTNATKHADHRPVRLTLTWSAGRLELTIANPVTPITDHRSDPVPSLTGTGHGLIGMRERAHTAGGELTHAHIVDGIFTVRAVLPTDRLSTFPPPQNGSDQ
jgi:signal transduction histidine kinase